MPTDEEKQEAISAVELAKHFSWERLQKENICFGGDYMSYTETEEMRQEQRTLALHKKQAQGIALGRLFCSVIPRR